MSNGDERAGVDEAADQTSERHATPHNPIVDGPREHDSAVVGDESQHGTGETGEETDADQEVGRIVSAIGTIGIYLGVCSLGLAVVGLVLGMFRIQPIASLSILLSLILVTVSMVFGAAFQAFGTDNSLLRGRG